jgi:hypothetical protein
MKQRIKPFLAGGIIALSLLGVAVAGQLDDAKDAYRRADYPQVLRLIRPLAEKGDAAAEYGLGSL